MFPLVLVLCYGYGYGYILGPSPVPPIYLAGSFGPVLLPGWLDYIRSTAVPQIVEGLTRPTSPLVRGVIFLGQAPSTYMQQLQRTPRRAHFVAKG